MKEFTEDEIDRVNKTIRTIGLLEMCFSGHHQEKKFNSIDTTVLNDLFLTVKYFKAKNNL